MKHALKEPKAAGTKRQQQITTPGGAMRSCRPEINGSPGRKGE